jgi:predicted DsbA family dithiol-disulfide isomerase
VKIEIWSDVVCPWCYIGKRRFDRALDNLRQDPEIGESGAVDRIDIVYRAYQLDPTAPSGSATPVRDVYARKFGGPERAQAIFEQLTEVAAAEDIAFDFDIAVRANTMAAHRLLWKTGTEFGYQVQARLKETLMAAYFTHGEDLGSITVLARCVALVWPTQPSEQDIAAFLDSDEGRAEVTIELVEAASHGITGVPTYLIDGQWAIPGAQDTETFERVLRRVLERQQ